MIALIQLPFLQTDTSAASRRPSIDWGGVAGRLMSRDALLDTIRDIIIILVVAFVAYRLIRLLVRRLVSYEVETDDLILKRVREQRAQTLGGLLQNVAIIVIITLTVLTILSTFMPIGPLLAGVSVVGLAVSFGAQSLVKDVISGTFILIEGQFGIGDVVRVGTTAGLVEKITLRTTVLRDHEGIVHVIPNGDITLVSNLTKNWSRAVLDLRIAYREDVDRVIRVLRDLGDEFQHDAQWAPLLLDPPEVLGVNDFTESGMIIRLQTKTLPLKQWEVARELRRRIKNRFDAENIQIPYPHLTFYWGDGQNPAQLNGEP